MDFHNFGSLPNLITFGRLILVPVIISLITAQRWKEACVAFIVAGISDGLDGWIAKTFNWRTELGAYLDPIADKALLVSIFVTLAIVGAIPATIAIIVVARDVMIVGAFLIARILDKPLKVRPLWISKLNTLAQILFAALVLSVEAFGVSKGAWFDASLYIVAALALASLGAYFNRWIRHMSA
ncbi:CDP-alcohol phosphatidyltransferase [Methylocella silvestris BL2]|uniref:CDP-diacylglycerol--glycerol-3-phosphate 3-phosphatidyltransferase n=1 Tax=Methylocella silvestris (strain DSM 15510 / CIP 108128 / LMG 27833 / NCIMB 13906 / BL2) TaxID=395965 RepID=B8EJY4_METSB|nr:CDP-alcohol phosphatidyltransferase family protein [Methylocella silvestris]ACK49931.1 CDP-alcohol phosphatidyltransferase [Methylocella silvestris BL2]